MTDRETLEILNTLLEKYRLTARERAALAAAISTLNWSIYHQKRTRDYFHAKKAKLAESMKW